MKKFVALFLTVVMLVGSLPVHTHAVDESVAQEETVSDKVIADISIETMAICSDPGLPENEELFAAYVQQELYGYGIATFGVAAGERLNSREKLIYDALVPVIKKIASGKRASTCIGLGKTVELSDGTVFPGDVSVDFTDVTISSDTLQNVMNALLCDFPYEMYWYDKVTGIGCSIIRSDRILNIYITFSVANNYSANGNVLEVDTAKTGATVNAVENAKKIVKKYADKTDYQKLIAYRDEICNLVSYNKPASQTGNFSQDNDPWQLIYVFDGDDTTKTVCEGYSKAFMYLCDLSVFSADIICYTVSGKMNEENHMWNIVTIDGASYLVDITNSDTGTVGADGRFFLAGTEGSPETGYAIKGTTYCYDANTLSFWGTDADSILCLEKENCPFSSAEDHEFGEWETVEERTCTQNGIERKTCKKCGYYEERALSAAGHNYTQTVTAPTCTEKGYTLYTCTCGDSYKDDYVDALNHSWDVGVITKEPTELEPGSKTYSCSACGETKTEEIPVLEHTHAYTDTVTNPTCTEKGYTTHSCACGESFVDSYVDALNHSWDSGVVTKEPTETETGIKTYTCSACSETKTEEIPMLDHTHVYTAVVTNPTCTQMGYTAHICLCGDRYVNTYTAPLGHTADTTTCTDQVPCERCGEMSFVHAGGTELRDTLDATCEAVGYTGDAYCKGCGEKLAAGQEIPALEHNFVSFVKHPYTKPAQEGIACEHCGCIKEAWEIGDPLGLPTPTVKGSNDPATGGALLTWEADGEADYYEIYRATKTKGKYTLVDTVTEAEAVLKISVGKSYYYKVKAVCETDAALSSGQSKYVKVTGKLAQPTVTVTTNTSGKPVLKWNKVSGAKKYYVYRSLDGGKETKIGTATKTTYTDSKAAAGKNYTYRVRAYGSKSSYTGAYSDGVVILAKCTQPVITVKINAVTGKPAISWKTVSGAESYLIQRKLAGESEFQDIQTVSALKYEDTTAPVDADAEYKVVAQTPENAYDSAPSAVKKIHTTLAKPVVTFSVDDVTGKPAVTWEAVEGAVKYQVYRSTKSTSSYKAVKTTTDLEYTDTSASVGKGYYYKVIAIGANSKSAYSSYKKLTAKCAQPVITVEANAAGKPVIKWSKVSGAKKYEIYRSAEGGSETKLATTTKTSYTDKTAANGVVYTYRIRACGSKAAYHSMYSETVAYSAE